MRQMALGIDAIRRIFFLSLETELFALARRLFKRGMLFLRRHTEGIFPFDLLGLLFAVAVKQVVNAGVILEFTVYGTAKLAERFGVAASYRFPIEGVRKTAQLV